MTITTEQALTLWKRTEGDEQATFAALHETLKQQLKSAVSYRSVALVAMQLADLGWEGMPYFHTRTFNQWKAAGRQVKKGEKSQIVSITWVTSKSKDGDGDSGRTWPKTTYLFHFDQTEIIGDGDPNVVPDVVLVEFEPRESAPKQPRSATSRKTKGKTAGLAIVQDGVEVTENEAKGGIEIRFSVKPSEELRSGLKSKGFRWSRAAGCWYAPKRQDTVAYAYGVQI